MSLRRKCLVLEVLKREMSIWIWAPLGLVWEAILSGGNHTSLLFLLFSEGIVFIGTLARVKNPEFPLIAKFDHYKVVIVFTYQFSLINKWLQTPQSAWNKVNMEEKLLKPWNSNIAQLTINPLLLDVFSQTKNTCDWEFKNSTGIGKCFPNIIHHPDS